ncbi:hypothetical protein Acr_23g0010410 [Actinidia rufa]|uniref:Uncharacterized protein n=1 Tax=Actinidia rufa TaxID=165716 RepID=A0A7J0GPA6_9ERIC|nr:hypothetical protein Acr_23g0010410 [Actinidia rufa]
MPNPKSHRRGQEEKNRRGKLGEKAASFHGRSPVATGEKLIRPRTVPDLLVFRSAGGEGGGPVAMGENLIRPRTVPDLLSCRSAGGDGGGPGGGMSEADEVAFECDGTEESRGRSGRDVAGIDRRRSDRGGDPAVREGRKTADPGIRREEQLMTLGSRNFFLFPIKPEPAPAAEGGGGGGGGGGGVTTPTASCSNQAEKASKIGLPWLKFLF